jgi:protein-tyrosine sulfotransferase
MGISRMIASLTFENMMLDRLLYCVFDRNLTVKIVTKKMRYLYDFMNERDNYVSSMSPVVIGGCARSGTTLVRALIGVHPQMASPQREWHVLLGKKYSGMKNRQRIKETFGLSDDEIDGLLKEYSNNIQFAENLFRLYMAKTNKNLISLKNPQHLYFIDELFQYFPHMFFIHVIRDGRDTVCSLRTHPKRRLVNGKFVPTNIRNPFDYCVRRWIVDVNRGAAGRKHDNYIEIKYEDIVNNTMATMEKLFGFLGLDMISAEEMLGFYRNERPENHPPNIEIGKPLYKGAIGKWKKEMTEDEKRLFKKMAGDVLIDLGYEKDFSW